MKQRILLTVVSVLSVSFCARASDLPDLEPVAARHKALCESIRSGRITYVEEQTQGTSDLAEFKKYYRTHLENYLAKQEAAGADATSIQYWRGQLADFDNAAARRLMSGTQRQRISCVFDMDQGAVRDERTDLRDIPAMMSQYGPPGEAWWYNQSMSTHLSSSTHKILSGDPPTLNIQPRRSAQLVVQPLWFAGWLGRAYKPAAEGEGGVDMRRDPQNPQHIIIEAQRSVETEETFFVVKNGQSTQVKLPLPEPIERKATIVLDEARDFRTASMTVFENGRPRYEYTYEHSSDEPLSLPAVVTIEVYRSDGSLERTTTYTMESVELNVPIAAAELELKVPPGTTIVDYTSGKPVFIQPEAPEDVVEQMVDETLEEMVEEVAAAEETRTSSAESEEPGAAEVAQPVPATPPAAGEPEGAGGAGGILTLAALIAGAVVIIALALVLRRRR